MNYLSNLIKDRNIIFQLAKNDFKVKYLGSYLGVFWAFFNPIISILIYWFVFQIGFRVTPIEDVPFVLWLVAGIIPWFFITEAISNGTNSILDNSYLVKKIVFKVSLLPIIKTLSTFFIHVIFLIASILLFFLYGYSLNIYYLQILYFLIASVILVYGISLITSSLAVFSRDIGQIVGMLLQFGFWLTPIFWSFSIVPPQIQFWFKLNPVYYIVEGYRNTFIYQRWFWEDPLLTTYFWIVTLFILIVGSIMFKKLKPHFSDVL
ncbi:ABC transporter permease [Lysinibacillus telephonicus]|uniref:Transport permease protein n=1 Tax=Lysinibacillus telephonicus TaxID=1714840 RepID=A0A3S0JRY3_9BACI|nr:ABC transporter permease [Lysinibacillus telephonicus]RTQ93151.1 ABC transporter permease [Lysinibacillus telephonicus]